MTSADAESLLIAELKSGSQEATSYLVKRSWPLLVSTAEMILSDRHQAEDVVQDSLIRALAKIEDFNPQPNINAWLKRIVINAAISSLRSRTRRSEISLDFIDTELDNGIRLPGQSTLSRQSTEELVSDAEIRQQVRDTIATLPEALRLPLYLRDIEGYSTRETANILELSEANLKIRLHRARTVLRQHLQTLWAGEN